MNEKVLQCDFMVKRAQMKAKLLKADNYKGRWFQLTKHWLYYSDGRPETGVGKVKGQILLSSVVIVEEAESEQLQNRPNAFQVVYRCGDLPDETCTLYIIALHNDLKLIWIEVLRKACLEAGAEFSPVYHPGVWISKTAKYSCCDTVNKRSFGCIPITHEVPKNSMIGAASLPTGGTRTHRHASTKLKKSATLPVRKVDSVYVVALHSHKPRGRDMLELVKGEEYELLEEYNSASWCLAKAANGAVGLIPANHVQLVNSETMEQYDWFYKNISRNESEAILEDDKREGCFMVRNSSRPGIFTLTILVKTSECLTPKHYHIKQTQPEGLYYLIEKHAFKTIQELVHYHKHNCAGLITRLRHPPSDRVKPSLMIDAKEIDPSDIELKEQLGAGMFGEITKGIYKHEIEVAVKTIQEGLMSEDAFLDEAKVMVKLEHNNLVKLYGVCTKKKEPLMIVTEYMKNGALVHFLRRQKHVLKERTSQLLDICIQVSSAMEYLETQGFIHRDLAARNCLVGRNTVVKVADFGLARFVIDDEYTSSFGSKYPVKWSSPEILGYTKFSSKSDVWAFGVLMWEVFMCGEMPFLGQKNSEVVDFVCMKRRHLSQPDNCPDTVFSIMLGCWQYDPEDRPTFAQLNKELVELMERDYVQ